MAERREFDQRYAHIWRSLANFLRNNSGFPVSGITRTGSRRRGDYEKKSDLDIIFSIAENPDKRSVYPDLVNLLKRGFPDAYVEIGQSYNVINFKRQSLDVDLVLLTEADFIWEKNSYGLEDL